MGDVMVVEMVFFGVCALLTAGAIVRDARRISRDPNYIDRPDRSTPGWGGAGASE